MFLTTLIIIIAVAGLAIVVLTITNREKSNWVQFYAKGKDSGFSIAEIELLRKLAVKSNLEDPASLYWSQNQLDLCIRSFVRSMTLSGSEDDQGNQDFLSKLYDYRKKIEMEKPKNKNGISNSSQIKDGQNLRILVTGVGVFRSQVVKNTREYLAITWPVSTKQPENFAWRGQKISVYFWREDDAGYVFDTHVEDEVLSKGITSLKISHSQTLFRTQKRKSIRVKMHKNAFLYLLTNTEEANKIEIEPGLKCFVEDLSDSGCAVTIGGKGAVDLRVKIQFALNGIPICMSGTVRSLEFKEDLDRSLLHIEADPLPIETRNLIMGEVFHMLPEEEEDLPFRLLGEEADDMTSELVPEKDVAEVEFAAQDESGNVESVM